MNRKKDTIKAFEARLGLQPAPKKVKQIAKKAAKSGMTESDERWMDRWIAWEKLVIRQAKGEAGGSLE